VVSQLNDSVLATDTGSVTLGRMLLGNLNSQTVTISRASGTFKTGYTLTGTGGATPGAFNSAAGAVPLSQTFSASVTNTTGDYSGHIAVQNTGDDGITGASSAGTGLGNAQTALNVAVTGTVVDKRVVSATAVDFGSNLLVGAFVSLDSNLATSGGDDIRTRVSVALTAAADANGIAITGSGQQFHSADAAGTRTLSGNIGYISGAFNSGPLLAVTTDENNHAGLTGETPYASIVSYTVNNVGYSTADQSGSLSAFGTALTAHVDATGSYAGLESTVSVGSASNGGALIPGVAGPLEYTTAKILAGKNSGAYTGGPATVSMKWRARTIYETGRNQGGNPNVPFIGSQGGGLISDVVQITGMTSANNNADDDHTDPFALQMSYDFASLGNDEVQKAGNRQIYVAWLNPVGSTDRGLPTNAYQWMNAGVTDASLNGNFLALGDVMASGGELDYQGTFSQFQNDYGTDLTQYIGAWGVDTDHHVAWAVVDHNSQFAVVPEPATFILAALGFVGLLSYRRRCRCV
jgi:PEP-CTERM motif-containing protein